MNSSGSLLIKKEEDKNESKKIDSAFGIVLFKDGSVEIAPQLTVKGQVFEFTNIDEAYRIICDMKNKLENMRAYFMNKELKEQYLNLMNSEENEEK